MLKIKIQITRIKDSYYRHGTNYLIVRIKSYKCDLKNLPKTSILAYELIFLIFFVIYLFFYLFADDRKDKFVNR